MNVLARAALATLLSAGPALASDSEWKELDKELEALSSSLSSAQSGGPVIDGWVITAFDWSSDIQIPNNGTASAEEDLGGFDLRSARLRVLGERSSYDYKFEAEFADAIGGSSDVVLLDAYGRANFNEHVGLSVGNYRTPFLQSSLIDRNKTLFVDRSFLGDQFDDRDLGAMLSGQHSVVRWYASAQNGVSGQGQKYLFSGRLALDVLGGGAGVVNEGAHGAPEKPAITLAASVFDDQGFDNGLGVSGEGFITTGPFYASFEIVDSDDDLALATQTPWAGTISYLFSQAWEVGFRYEQIDDTEDTKQFNFVLNRYVDGHDIKWQLQFASNDKNTSTLESDVFTVGAVVSF